MRTTGCTSVVPRLREHARPISTVASRPAMERKAASSSSMWTEGTQESQPGGFSYRARVCGETRANTSSLPA